MGASPTHNHRNFHPCAFWYFNISTMMASSISVTKPILRISLPFTCCYLPLVLCQSVSKLQQFHQIDLFNAKHYTIWMACMVISTRLVMLNSLITVFVYKDRLKPIGSISLEGTPSVGRSSFTASPCRACEA